MCPALERLLAEACQFRARHRRGRRTGAGCRSPWCARAAPARTRRMGVEFDITPYPQQAIATRLECELPHGQVARRWFTPAGEILAFCRTGRWGRQVAVVWSVRAERVPG